MNRTGTGAEAFGNSQFGPVGAMLAGAITVSLLLTIALFWGKTGSKDWAIPELRDLPQIRSGKEMVRRPFAAGQFYPADPAVLYESVERLMSASATIGMRSSRAVLVPHAGFEFSGEIAATSFREIRPDFKRVFLLAANHNGKVRYSGVSIPEVTHYGIPGAQVPLSAIADELKTDPLFRFVPAAHTMHMIEIELPFLHYLRGRPEPVDFSIVPMILGQMDEVQINRLVTLLQRYAEPGTIFVFSVDLSHFYEDATARKLDSYTIEKIMGRDGKGLARAVTDGNNVLMTMVELAKRQDWEATYLGYRNSGEVNSDLNRVVGYSSVVFSESFYLTAEERHALLTVARTAIQESLNLQGEAKPDPELLDRYPILRIPRGVFVTLNKDGRLRGCMGHLVSHQSIYEGVRSCAVNAALRDPRFQPLGEEELDDLTISISILDYPGPVRANSPEEYTAVLKPGRDGVILIHEGRQSTFLPKVWLELPEPQDFLASLSRKQGSPADSWRDPKTVLLRYHAYEFGE